MSRPLCSFRWIFLFCAAALLLTLYVHIAPAIWYNARLRMKFVPTGVYPYTNGISPGTTNGDIHAILGDFYVDGTYTWGIPNELQDIVIRLPTDVQFYTSLSACAPVLELPAGTRFIMRNVGCIWDDSHCYLQFGLPTYRKGWRCTVIHDAYDTDVASGKKVSGLVFIKTDDLFAMAQALYDAGLTHAISEKSIRDTTDRLGLSKEDYCRYMVLTTDRYMYENGIYLSPDLLMQVWDTPAALLLSGSALSLAGFLLVTFRRRNRRFPDTPSKNDLT